MSYVYVLGPMMMVMVGCGSAGVAQREAAGPTEPAAVGVLVDFLRESQRGVWVTSVGDEWLWTDKAILERTRAVPATLQRYVSERDEAGGPEPAAMLALIQDAERHLDAWSPAELLRRGNDRLGCYAVEDITLARLNCVYVDYLAATHPGGQWYVKGALEPVLYVEGTRVRGLIMPLASAND